MKHWHEAWCEIHMHVENSVLCWNSCFWYQSSSIQSTMTVLASSDVFCLHFYFNGFKHSFVFFYEIICIYKKRYIRLYIWPFNVFVACVKKYILKVSKVAKIRNRYNQVPHLTQDTNGKVKNSQKTPQTRAKRSALSQQVTTKHI